MGQINFEGLDLAWGLETPGLEQQHLPHFLLDLEFPCYRISNMIKVAEVQTVCMQMNNFQVVYFSLRSDFWIGRTMVMVIELEWHLLQLQILDWDFFFMTERDQGWGRVGKVVVVFLSSFDCCPKGQLQKPQCTTRPLFLSLSPHNLKH